MWWLWHSALVDGLMINALPANEGMLRTNCTPYIHPALVPTFPLGIKPVTSMSCTWTTPSRANVRYSKSSSLTFRNSWTLDLNISETPSRMSLHGSESLHEVAQDVEWSCFKQRLSAFHLQRAFAWTTCAAMAFRHLLQTQRVYAILHVVRRRHHVIPQKIKCSDVQRIHSRNNLKQFHNHYKSTGLTPWLSMPVAKGLVVTEQGDC